MSFASFFPLLLPPLPDFCFFLSFFTLLLFLPSSPFLLHPPLLPFSTASSSSCFLPLLLSSSSSCLLPLLLYSILLFLSFSSSGFLLLPPLLVFCGRVRVRGSVSFSGRVRIQGRVSFSSRVSYFSAEGMCLTGEEKIVSRRYNIMFNWLGSQHFGD